MATDVPATNGIIHVIQEGVLVPDDAMAELATRLPAVEPESTMMETDIVTEDPTVTVDEPGTDSRTRPPVLGLW